jgi:hypothetical protein
MTGYQFSDSEGYNADGAADFAEMLAAMTPEERDDWEAHERAIAEG